jgi:hypothetical protein
MVSVPEMALTWLNGWLPTVPTLVAAVGNTVSLVRWL